MSQEIPANHSPHFAPVEEPTLLTATRTQVVAALAYLGAERRDDEAVRNVGRESSAAGGDTHLGREP